MTARWGAVLLVLALLGAAGGLATRGALQPQLAQTGGTSGGNSGGNSGNGSSGSGNGSSGTSEADGSSGTSENDGSSGTSGSDGSSGTSEEDGTSNSPAGDGGDGDPSGTTAPGGGGTATTTPGGGRGGEAPIPQPTTASSIPANRVSSGKRTGCGSDVPAGVLCFLVGDATDAEGVRIPDGVGGFVIVPILPIPVANVDTGASTSASSNVDLQINVNRTTGEVVRVERRADEGRQAVLGTVAALLLVLTFTAVIATYLGVRRYWGR